MDVIEKIFKQNPQINQLFKTKDGQLFFSENYAVLHDKENAPELIKRESVLKYEAVNVPVFSSNTAGTKILEETGKVEGEPDDAKILEETGKVEGKTEELTGEEFEPEMLVEELPKTSKPKK